MAKQRKASTADYTEIDIKKKSFTFPRWIPGGLFFKTNKIYTFDLNIHLTKEKNPVYGLKMVFLLLLNFKKKQCHRWEYPSRGFRTKWIGSHT